MQIAFNAQFDQAIMYSFQNFENKLSMDREWVSEWVLYFASWKS